MSVTQNKKVLVLNKSWNAIGVVTLERAIVMLFTPCRDRNGEILRDAQGEEIPKAKIIDPTRDFQDFTWKKWSELKVRMDDEVVRSANMVFRVPEVILLTKYDKMPQHKIHFSRRTIYKRDGNRCQYCGVAPGTEELTIDHVIPRSAGGKTTWENCVLACVGCNSKKADRMPEATTIVKHVDGKTVHVPAFTVFFNDKVVPKKTIRKPKKPTVPLFRGDARIKSWEAFLGAAFWEVELDNDNAD
jgi:5-methylcytosine-specific restriction endonuclease McrA